MISFVIGTSAEVLKLKNVWISCREKKVDFKVISLGQHGESLQNQLKLECTENELVFINEGQKSLTTNPQALLWFFCSIWKLVLFLNSRKHLSVLVVQGDTLSTLIGAICGKLLGRKVLHIEAGLRSKKIFNPFPEEITRRLVSKLSAYHVAPGEREVNQLFMEGIKSNRIRNSKGNTGLDNIQKNIKESNLLSPYAIVTLHRTEILRKPPKLEEVFTELSKISNSINIYCYLDTRAIHALNSLNFPISGISLGPRVPYHEFISNVKNAEWVFTDSGGLQEECAHLGIPTYVHRLSTERFEGINENIIISNWNISSFKHFLNNYKNYQRPAQQLKNSPSKSVVAYLEEWDLL